MNKPFKWFLSIALLFLIFVTVVLPERLQVLSPRLGMPVVLRAQETFTLQLQSSLPFVSPDVAVTLVTKNLEIPLSLKAVKSGVVLHELSVELPASVQAGQYSLRVDKDGQQYVRPNSVYVVDNYPKTMSIVQLADLPVLGNGSGGSGDGDKLLKQITDEINIINPNVVLLTGDLAYGGSWDQYVRLLKAMEQFDMPVIAAPGNHEYEGWGGYLSLLGQPYHVIDYGNYRFVSLNSGHGKDQLTQSQYAWFKQVLSQGQADTIPIIQIHHPLHHKKGLRGYLQVHVHDVVDLVNQYQIPVVLSGHWHGDAVYDRTGRERKDTWQFDGAPYVVTTTAGADLRQEYSNSPLHHGYRLLRLEQRELLSYTYDYDADGVRDSSSSIPAGKLKVHYESPDTAIVKNDLNESFADAKIKFSIAGGSVDVKPNIGHIVKSAIVSGRVEFEIVVDLLPNSQTTVKLIRLIK